MLTLTDKEYDSMLEEIERLKALCARAADSIEACSIRYDRDLTQELRKAAQ